MCLKALRDLLHIGLDTSHTWIGPPSLEIPATMMTLGTAIWAKRRSHPVPISVLPGNTHAAIEKGTSMKKIATPLAGATLALIAVTVSLACNEAFAQPPTIHNLKSAKPPTDVGGASARAYIIQNANIKNDRMWSVDGRIYRNPNGTYFKH